MEEMWLARDKYDVYTCIEGKNRKRVFEIGRKEVMTLVRYHTNGFPK